MVGPRGHADDGVGGGRRRVGIPPAGSFLRTFAFRPHQVKAACDVVFPRNPECHCVRVVGEADNGKDKHVFVGPRITWDTFLGILVPVLCLVGPCPLGRQSTVPRPVRSGEFGIEAVQPCRLRQVGPFPELLWRVVRVLITGVLPPHDQDTCPNGR